MSLFRSAKQFASKRFFSIPYVIESKNGSEQVYDIYSRLLKDRIICVHGEVNGYLANSTVAQLLFLESTNPELPIFMYINSPGGSVSDGMAIYDTMRYIHPQIHTYCMGMCASMGSLLLTAGDKRFALPNSKIMVHQPSGGASGQASDIAIHAKEILKTREKLNKIYAIHTGQTIEAIEHVMERDTYMDPEEAVQFGLIDKIISKAEKSK